MHKKQGEKLSKQVKWNSLTLNIRIVIIDLRKRLSFVSIVHSVGENEKVTYLICNSAHLQKKKI